MRKHHEASPQDINFSKFFPSSAKTRAMKGTKTKQKKTHSEGSQELLLHFPKMRTNLHFVSYELNRVSPTKKKKIHMSKPYPVM